MASWRHIATAPKDGTVILGWSTGWSDPHPELVYWDTARAVWASHSDPILVYVSPKLTHWIAIPPYPKTE